MATKSQRKAELAAKKKKAKDKRRKEFKQGEDIIMNAIRSGEDLTEIEGLINTANNGAIHKKAGARLKLAWKLRKYVGGSNG